MVALVVMMPPKVVSLAMYVDLVSAKHRVYHRWVLERSPEFFGGDVSASSLLKSNELDACDHVIAAI